MSILYNYFSKNILIVVIAVIGAALLSVAFSGFLRTQEERGGASYESLDAAVGTFVPPARLPIYTPTMFAMAQDNPDYIPIRDWSVEEPEIDAKAVLAIIPGKNKILFQRNIDEKLPIASLTKIMAAAILLNKAEPKKEVMVKYSHVMTEGENGDLVVGEKLSFANLLKIMLIASSNDAAEVIAEAVGEKLRNSDNILKSPRDFFVEAMNGAAINWGLESTYFATPTGLSDDDVSSARDLAFLTSRLLAEYPLIWEISALRAADARDSSGLINHHLVNTNELLFTFDDIIGGKTGYTETAGGCIIIIKKAPKQDENVIYIVLGSGDRFLNVKILMEWVNKAFLW